MIGLLLQCMSPEEAQRDIGNEGTFEVDRGQFMPSRLVRRIQPSASLPQPTSCSGSDYGEGDLGHTLSQQGVVVFPHPSWLARIDPCGDGSS